MVGDNMEKKFIPILAGVIAVTTLSAAILLTPYYHSGVNSETYKHIMNLDKNNQIQYVNSSNTDNYSIGTTKTNEGTDIRFAYSMNMMINPSDDFVVMSEDEYFELDIPMNGLLEMEYVIDGSLTIEIGYRQREYIQSIPLTSTEGYVHSFKFTEWVDGYGIPPCYFKISCDDAHVNVHSLKLYYTCVASPDPTEYDGEWETEYNSDLGSSLTITGYHIDQDRIPESRALIIPSTINGEFVTRINEGVFSNVPWVEHVILPFVGECQFLEQEGCSYNFASIFGKNSAHNKYQPIQQYEGTTVNIWYVPKSLHKITITGGNLVRDPYQLTYHYIPSYGFYGCGSLLKSINVIGDIEEISSYAFTNCSTMQEIVLPETMQKVCEGAFTGCNHLLIRSLSTSLDMPDEANPNNRPYSLGYKETFKEDDVTYDLCTKENGDEYLNLISVDSKVKILNIPSSVIHDGKTYNVRRVANRAFEDKTDLRAVNFNSDLELVGHNLFQNAYKASAYMKEDPTKLTDKYLSNWNNGLCEFYVDIDAYESDEQVYYYKTSLSIYFVDVNAAQSDRVTLDLVDYGYSYDTVLPHHAFDGDARIKKVIFPNNIVFKPYSFANCHNLEEIEYDGTMDEFVQLKNDGRLGFNSFVNTKINQIKCSDGWVSID